MLHKAGKEFRGQASGKDLGNGAHTQDHESTHAQPGELLFGHTQVTGKGRIRGVLFAVPRLQEQGTQEEEHQTQADIHTGAEESGRDHKVQDDAHSHNGHIRQQAKVNEHDLDQLLDGLAGGSGYGQVDEGTDGGGEEVNGYHEGNPGQGCQQILTQQKGGSYDGRQQVQQTVGGAAHQGPEQLAPGAFGNQQKMVHFGILGQRVAHGPEETETCQSEDHGNQTVGIQNEPAQGGNTQTGNQIGFRGLGEDAQVSKTEAVIHGLEEEYIGTLSVAHSVPAQPVGAVFLPLDQGNGALFSLGPGQKLRGLLGLGHGILIEVGLYMPDHIGEGGAACCQSSQAQEHGANFALHSEHTEAFQPAPEGDIAGCGAIEELVRSHHESVFTAGSPIGYETRTQNQKQSVNAFAQVVFQLGMGGENGVQQDLQQLAHQDGQTPGGDGGQCCPGTQTQIQHQVGQLEQHVNTGKENSAQLGRQPEQKYRLGLHGGGEQQVYIRRQEDLAAVFVSIDGTKYKHRKNDAAYDQLHKLKGLYAQAFLQGDGVFFLFGNRFHDDLFLCFGSVFQHGSAKADETADDHAHQHEDQHPCLKELFELVDKGVPCVISE